MKVIRREYSTFALSKEVAPVEKAVPGEIIVFETSDSYDCQIKSEDQPFSTINMQHNNPATGPLYIEGAEPGDILKVEIMDVSIADKGVMTARPGAGILKDYFDSIRIKIIPIKDNKAVFNDKIELPVNTMIGVIGTAPAEGDMCTTVPHLHGGNMDCKRIVKGSMVYLPVFVKGALLSMGDLHAVMGDGEIVICGLEINGEVTVKVDVIKNKNFPLPMLIEGEHIMTIASEETLDDAAKQATINMHQFLVNEVKMDSHDAGLLLSLVGDLRICQVVDPLMTARMEFPLSILEKYNYKMV